MAKPRTRQELIDYCLRSLGAPVIEINLDGDQIEDRVDEAIQFYQEYHSDAVVRTFVKHQITAQDVINEYIPLPEALISVLQVLPITSTNNSSGGFFSIQNQIASSDILNFFGDIGGLVDYEISKQYLTLIDMSVNGLGQQIIFSRHMNRLNINVKWDEHGLTEGRWVVIEGYVTINPEEFGDIYNDMMLKKHLKALLKRNWGENLIKMEGMQLPGGVTINARAIFEDAMAEIAKIEEEYDMKYSFPPDFFIG